MRYAERVSDASKPNCWGNPDAYDAADTECRGCAYKHSCRNEAERSSTGYRRHSSPIRRTSSRNRFEETTDPVTVTPTDIVAPGEERAVDRFFKDATGGAMRGMFYEMYKFWTKYRIP
jgi:hypothetical protein